MFYLHLSLAFYWQKILLFTLPLFSFILFSLLIQKAQKVLLEVQPVHKHLKNEHLPKKPNIYICICNLSQEKHSLSLNAALLVLLLLHGKALAQHFIHLCTSAHSSSTRGTRSWVRPSEHTRTGQVLPGCFSKHLENVARLPLLLWGNWGTFKIPQCSYSSLREGYKGIPNPFRSYFPALLCALQVCRSELIPEAGMHCHCLFRNIISQRTTSLKSTFSTEKAKRVFHWWGGAPPLFSTFKWC